MPEGPEILYSSIIIKKIINNYNFTEIISNTDKNISIPIKIKHMVKNNEILKVINVSCKGKLLWIELKNQNTNDNIFIHIHYGLHGWMHDIKPEKYIDYTITFKKTKINKTTNKQSTKEKYLYMEDKIKWNKISFMFKQEHEIEIETLGVDIFSKEFTKKFFKEIMTSKKKAMLANFLLDQHTICGIGNYIKNEAMYLTKLNVFTKMCDLTKEQINNLYKNILFVAYSKLITHKKNAMKYLPEDKQINKPKITEYPYQYKVYNQSETSSGEKVTKVTVGGRGSFSTKEYIENKNVKCKKDNKEIKIKKEQMKKKY